MKDNQAKYPQLRFKGFTDPWEQDKLDYIFDILDGDRGKNYPSESDFLEEGPTLFLDTGNVRKNGFLFNTTKYITKERDCSLRSGKLQLFDFVLTSRGTLGNVAYYDKKTHVEYQSVRINSAMLILRPIRRNIFSDLYLKVVLHGNLIENFMKKNHVGSAQPHITKKDFSKMLVGIPSTFKEQEKIGSLFNNLDFLITLHQRKLAKLKELKQGYLQKLFPKNGSKFPQLRFAGFADAWEQRKFFDNIKATIDYRGRTPKKIGLNWSKSGYLALSALNVKNGYIDKNIDAHYGNRNLYEKWMGGNKLKKGEVLFTTEAPMGNVAQVPDDAGYILSQRTISFKVFNDKVTDDFLAVILSSNGVQNKLKSLSSGGTALGISQRSLKGLKITLPVSLKEQSEISALIKLLSGLIAANQRKLEKLQELKKGYLQKMFC